MCDTVIVTQKCTTQYMLSSYVNECAAAETSTVTLQNIGDIEAMLMRSFSFEVYLIRQQAFFISVAYVQLDLNT